MDFLICHNVRFRLITKYKLFLQKTNDKLVYFFYTAIILCMKMIFLSNLDVTDSNSFEAVVKNVQDIAGDDGLNLLINNAACNNFQNYDDVTEDGMMEIFRSNTVAPLMLSKVSYFTGTQLGKCRYTERHN